MNRPQPLSRAAKQTQDSPAIVPAKIDRAIEPFVAQSPNDGPGLLEPGPATAARHRPDTVQPGRMIKNWRHLLRHENMQHTVGPALPNRPQRGNHQDRVAEVFELNRQDFKRGPGHGVFFQLNVRPTDFSKLLRSEEHTSELQSQSNLVCRLLLEKKKEPRPTRPSSVKTRN